MRGTLLALMSVTLSLFAGEALAQFGSQREYTIEEMNRDLSELRQDAEKIPPADLMPRELSKIDGIVDKAFLASTTKIDEQELQQFSKNKNRVADIIASIISVSCTNDSVKFTEQENELISRYEELSQMKFFNHVDFSVPIIWRSDKSVDVKSRCNEAKTIIAAGLSAKLDSAYDSAIKILGDKRDERVLYVKTANDVFTAAKARKQFLEKNSSKLAALGIADNLPLIILCIGAFSVASMSVVYLFDENIQMEWVASGQVIQFVTVTVLLSVILALGISRILAENVLGTLLGGVAGYVLAQGVGRSAARASERASGPSPQRGPLAPPRTPAERA